MKLLAFESPAKAAGVAVLDDGRLLAEYFQNSGQTHSRTLMQMAEDLLDNCDLTPRDIDACAVADGPGSFTGVRIGVAAAKGFAWGGRFRATACRRWRRWRAARHVWAASSAAAWTQGGRRSITRCLKKPEASLYACVKIGRFRWMIYVKIYKISKNRFFWLATARSCAILLFWKDYLS